MLHIICSTKCYGNAISNRYDKIENEVFNYLRLVAGENELLVCVSSLSGLEYSFPCCLCRCAMVSEYLLSINYNVNNIIINKYMYMSFNQTGTE